MKVTLDLTELLAQGKITQEEHDRLLALAARNTGSMAFNILIGFGVICVAGGGLALVPAPPTAMLIGAVTAGIGFYLSLFHREQWGVLGTIAILIGALFGGGGIVAYGQGSTVSVLLTAALFAGGAVLGRSGMLMCLAVLAVSGSMGTITGYEHACYFLCVEKPTYSILLFTAIAVVAPVISKQLPAEYARLAIFAARTSVLLVNFAFWIGSLWGDDFEGGSSSRQAISDVEFVIAWAVALAGAGVWAWWVNRPWLVSVVAVFGAIHLYTQYFERLGASPGSIVVGGLAAIAIAVGIWKHNRYMLNRAPAATSA
jgi:iron complex transport system permease protein